ncbi:class F sortase [Halolactibacillus alkaliphilus]|uniref:class F sortase n=1 Tax=Halolactibacillus alkaliphilus TaxID=442899 RepID=UPI0011BE2E67|nr:class F sortase [Halolactibacillus alkaliphilus]
MVYSLQSVVRLSDKIVILSLSFIIIVSFGQVGVNAYQTHANAFSRAGDAHMIDGFSPRFKSMSLFQSDTLGESRKVTLEPVYSGPVGIIPTHLSIDKIGVDTFIEQVGHTANGQMGVPENTDQVGWYKHGKKAGSQGQAVLAGHVNDRQGPSVFYRLDELEKGDVITVTDDAGEMRQFAVVSKTRYPYDTTAIDEVFGPTSKQRLNLITCIGEFDQTARTHSERLVVFAEQIN